MTTFEQTEPVRGIELRNKIKATAGAMAFLGALGVSTYLVTADSKMDILGDWGKERTFEDADAIAQQSAQTQYNASNMSGKYAMLYLGTHTGYLDRISISRLEDNNGIAGFLHDIKDEPPYSSYDIPVGQDCLAGSAFDTRPSEIRGRAHGDISAVASITIEEDLVAIRPAATNTEPLRFEQDETGLLVTADSYTDQTLRAYGCAPEAGL